MSTVLHRLYEWAQSSPNDIAQKYLEGNSYKNITSKEYWDNIYYLALFLESKGVTREDIGAIFAYNSPWWVHFELATVLLGAKSVGLYPNFAFKDIAYILEHTNAKVVAVQNKEYYERMIEGGLLPEYVKFVLCFEDDISGIPNAVSYNDAIKVGRELAKEKKAEDYLNKLDPKEGTFLIYTSGTTGNPKGAMVSHYNILFVCDQVFEDLNIKRAGSSFSFLPLCHIAEKLQNIGIGIVGRYTVYYCSDIKRVADEMRHVQASLVFCVPRVWEKMVEIVELKIKEKKGILPALARRGLKFGEKAARAKYYGEPFSAFDHLRHKIYNTCILSLLRKKMGLGNVTLAVSGSAALAPHITRWFQALGIEIVEVFGQTESTAITTFTRPGYDWAGTVGKPITGTEVKIAEDGEIITKGGHVFVGYYKNEEATAATLIDGWLHTGDLGELTDDGVLKIRGRKKEILKTSGGKMLAPVPIEEDMKRSPLISQVCIVGDGRKYFTALVTLSQKAVRMLKKEEIEKRFVIGKPELVEQVTAFLKSVNDKLSNYARIKYFTLLVQNFSVEKGEMTPTLKLKRAVIEKVYRKVIDNMYDFKKDIEKEVSECPLKCVPGDCECRPEYVQSLT